MKRAIASLEVIENRILLIRGHKVMVDADLASVYGVTTKRLNEQVKRNRDRFPDDFMFQLTEVEKAEVVANCDHLKKLKFSKAFPYAFTEHGAIMLKTSPANSISLKRNTTTNLQSFLMPSANLWSRRPCRQSVPSVSCATRKNK